MRSMVPHLARDPQKVKMCSGIIIEQEKRVFMERVTHPETTVGTCHYLPHHAVFKESATTPIRVVCKCSCRQSQEHPRLNDSLLPWPPITNDLTAILPRFPHHEYGFATDIYKAFLNIKIDEQDRDATRFLCLSYLSDTNSPFQVYPSRLSPTIGHRQPTGLSAPFPGSPASKPTSCALCAIPESRTRTKEA